MKFKTMKRIEISIAALLLTLLLGCGPGKEPACENKAPATNAPAVEAAKTAAPAEKPATPASVAETATPAVAPLATGMVRYDAEPTGSKMKIEGESNIHSWKMESAVLGGFMEVDAKFPEALPADAKTKAEVFMPVRSFKSGNKTMDGKMQDTMKEAQFKKIEYKLTDLKAKAGAAGQFEATGALTIAGQTKTTTMTVTAEKVEGTKLKLSGSLAFKMTDYGVTPPTLTIAGVGLKTYDDVTNSFEWVLAPKAP